MLAVSSTIADRMRAMATGARRKSLRTGTAVVACAAAVTGAGALAVLSQPAAASAAVTGSAAAAGPTASGDPVVAGTSATIDVTNLHDAGPGSLRWALQRAGKEGPGVATHIEFTVAGGIRLLSPLPAVKTDVVIDGTTAPGWKAGSPPRIAINFAGQSGLTFAPGAAHSRLLGVAIENARGNGITLSAQFVIVNLDYIGLSVRGARAGNRGDGIYASGRSGNDQIGLNSSGQPGSVGNVISGNAASGIVIDGSSGDTIEANRIGTTPSGNGRLGNGRNGIVVTGRADRTEIGGTAFTDPATGQANNPTGSKGTVPPVFVVPALGNLISGNAGNGVLINGGATRAVLNGNFIGTTASGDGRLGNAGNGVWIDHANHVSLTGCKFINNPFVYYNVLSANGQNGLRVTDSADAVVQGNFFGTGANNSTRLGNRRNGILVDGRSVNTQVGGVIPLGNVAAANRQNGIEVAGRARGFVTFNTFGGLVAFGGAAPNGNDGILITSTGGDNLVRTNVFSGNRHNGIQLAGNASGVTVDPDIAGLSTNGMSRLANGGDGLLIDGNAHSNVIGGSLRSVIAQNTFSGNAGYGVAITGRAYRNRVFTSYIGTQILGVKPLPNHKGGILIGGRAHANLIGGGKLPANLVSGNIGAGVTLGYRTSRNLVLANYIGLDRLGRRLPNTGRPVVNRGRRNLIRGNRA